MWPEYMLYLGDNWHVSYYMDIFTHEVYGVVTMQEYKAHHARKS